MFTRAVLVGVPVPACARFNSSRDEHKTRRDISESAVLPKVSGTLVAVGSPIEADSPIEFGETRLSPGCGDR